jgi:S1-C subfamily serine protease
VTEKAKATPSLSAGGRPKSKNLLPLFLIIGGAAALLLLVMGVAVVAGVGILLVANATPSVAQVTEKPEKAAAADKKRPTRDERSPSKDKGSPGEKKATEAEKSPKETKTTREEKSPQEKESPTSSGQLDRQTVDRVKAATFYMRVRLANGRVAQGSGFAAHQPGLLFTNAHVLGMLEPEDQEPTEVLAVANSGRSNERTYKAKILAVDRVSDLAVLRLVGADLPKPLEIRSAKDLFETQSVIIVGFPLGDSLGKDVTVSKSSVSSLRVNSLGRLHQIQVNGGMHPGNSGGPVINERGEIIGVAVAGIKGTQINFAIPGDVVQTILNGRVTGIQVITVAGPQGPKANARLSVVDPLERLKRVALEYWTGPPGKRPPSKSKPAPEPGDGPVQTVELIRAGSDFQGQFPPPNPSPGQVCWARPVVVNGADESLWSAAVTFNPRPVALPPELAELESRPVLLQYRPLQRAAELKLRSKNRIKIVADENLDFVINMEATMHEQPVGVDPQTGLARLRLQYRRYTVGVPTKLLTPADHARLGRVIKNAGALSANLWVDRRGKLVRNEAVTVAAPPDVRRELEDLHSQIQDSLEALVVPIPGRQINPGEAWQDSPNLFIGGIPTGDVPARLKLIYRYLGVRKRGNREQAVIRISGQVVSRPGVDIQIRGEAKGMAFFDMALGQLTEAHVTVGSAVTLNAKGRRLQLSSTLESHLERTVAGIMAGNPGDGDGAQ